MTNEEKGWPYENANYEGLPQKTHVHRIVTGTQNVDTDKQAERPARTVQVKGDHYKKYPIQPYEYNQRNGLRYCEGNVVKYVTRHRDKGGKDDILKAIHYLQLLLEEEYNK